MKTVERRVKRVDVMEGRQVLTEDEKKRAVRATGTALELQVLTPELQAIREQLGAMAKKLGEALPEGAHLDDMDGRGVCLSIGPDDDVEFTFCVYVRGPKARQP